jgi:predicted AlkP superfamily pyrophosphatase or phosphodiesterase
MRRPLVVTALLLGLFPLVAPAQSAPKLVVVLVVDQMRGDYLTRFAGHWRAGFKTLLTEGAVFENANYAHLHTFTCAGHATIGTGAFPRTHGMISNAWWNRETRTSPECTADAKVPPVTYGANVTTGSSPERLLVPTLADELRAQKPGARVVAVSLKSRGAITLAGRAADAIVWFDDAAATFTTSRAYSEAPVPEVKRFIDANPVEKQFGQSWTLLAAPATYLRRDSGIGERPPGGWTSLFPHVISVPTPPAPGRGRGAGRGAAAPATTPAREPAPAGDTAAASQPAQTTAGRGTAAAPAAPVVTATQAAGQWQASPYADRYIARMAMSLAESFQLGRRTGTDFLSISFSTLDDVGHAFGPESREVEDILRHLDVTLGELIGRLDTTVGRANYVLALSADHGVAPFSGMGLGGGRVHTEDIRDRIEEILVGAFGPPQKLSYIDNSSSGYIYFAPGVAARVFSNAAVMAAIDREVKAIPGVTHVLRTDQLSETSRDPIVRAAARTHVPGRGGDLLVVAREGWSLGGRAVYAANHGSPYRYDTHVPVIFLGGGIRAVKTSAAATPADIAPTLAELAGVKMPKADGRALRDVRR